MYVNYLPEVKTHILYYSELENDGVEGDKNGRNREREKGEEWQGRKGNERSIVLLIQ
jgi:hypothetical protein